MHAGKKFSLKEVLLWTRREIFVFFIVSAIPTTLYIVLGWHWLSIPWLPVALIGTAVAFLIGFKNNASYSRLWEARMIWGSIVNDSRTWGIYVKDYVNGQLANPKISKEELKEIHTRLIYRHIGWLTALRFQLRQPKLWENMEKPYAKEYRKIYSIPEWETKFEDEVKPYLLPQDFEYIMKKSNRATQIISLQSMDLKEIRSRNLIDSFPYVEQERLLEHFYTHQGKAERIKNFPYPRQFASFNIYFVWLFIFMVPLGMLHEIGDKMGGAFVWMTIPFSVLVAWVFHTMEKIGEATENPFEGNPNDIPMTALSRTIEIDLREMLDEEEIPEPIKPVNNILM